MKRYILIFCILFGVFIRFYGLGSGFIIRDGVDFMIAGIKLHHNNPYDARLWNLEHPPVGKWFFGLPTLFIKADYEPTLKIPVNMYVWQYRAYEALEKTYAAMRGVSALFGSLSLLFIFLIARELYGFESALWAAATAALSFDLITYSRGDMADIYMVFFTLGAILFYLKYLKAKDETIKTRYLILTFAFFALNLGTRSLQPLFLIPILLISQFFFYGAKSKFHLPFIVAMGFGLYIFLYIIYPPEIRELSLTFHHRVGSVLELLPLEFNFHKVVISLFVRNSYLFAAGVILLVHQLYLSRNKSLNKYIQKPKPELFLAIFFLIGFLALGGMRYGSNIRYLIFIYLPAFVFAGEQMNKLSRDKKILSLLLALVLINIYGIVKFFPNFSDYTNFGVRSYMIYDTSGGYDNFPRIKEALSYLDSIGRPPIISNDPNILIFYRGEKTDIPIPDEAPKCNPAYFQNYEYIVYYPRANPHVDIQLDQYMCPYARQLPLRIEKTFGTREDNPGIIIFYRIGPRA